MNVIASVFLLLLACLSLLACSPQTDSAQLPVRQLSAVADCDVLTSCRVSDTIGHIDILFAATPRALQSFPVVIKPKDMVGIKSVSVSFSMRNMVMGANHYALMRTSTGEWRGAVTLPVCVSGRTDWVADFDVQLPDRQLVFAVPFVLAK